MPQYVIGLLGTWKAGGIAVPINPMNRQRELELLLTDSGARVLCDEIPKTVTGNAASARAARPQLS